MTPDHSSNEPPHQSQEAPKKVINYFAIIGLLCALAPVFIEPEGLAGPRGSFGAFTHFPPAGSHIWVEWFKGLLGLAALFLGVHGANVAKVRRTGRGIAIAAIIWGILTAIANLTQAAIWSGMIP